MDLQYLADLEEIRQLGHRYVNLCDDGFDAAKMADLFARDGIWECPGRFGPFKGRDALMDFFSTFGGIVHFCLHGHCNDEIDIDGDTATGRWSVIAALTYERNHGPEDTWSFLIYRAQYVRTGGLWKFKYLEATARAEGPNGTGWVDWLNLPEN